MVQTGLTVDMGTAVHSKCLHKIERAGGEITEALQKTFPPDWNSFNTNAILNLKTNEEGLDIHGDDGFDDDDSAVWYNTDSDAEDGD